jgi:type I restriction enzyme, S subunit
MAEQTKMKVPEVRFKGFFEEWEVMTLGELLPITSAARVHKNEWTESGVPFFRSSDVVSNYKGNENKKAFISHELYRELTGKIGRVKIGDILITGGGSIGIPYLIDSDDPLYFKDADLLWLKIGEDINCHFLYTFFSAQPFRQYVRSISHIGTIAHYTVEQAKSTPIGFPKINEEQHQIGTYFQELDQMIGLHQRKHEKLVTLKKAMLKKMFPQYGATTPEIRFKGFSEPWEEKKIGEICGDTYGGGTPRTSEGSFWNGSIDWIQSSDLTSDQLTNVAPRKSITEDGLKASATKLIPENSIAIVTRVGVGKLALILHKYATSQDFLSLSKLRIDAWYAVYSIWKTLQSKLHTVQGTSIKGLTKEELLSMQMLVPVQEAEQKKIGTYFRQMDELIAQHGTQIEKLKQIKAACLEKMFV